MKYTNSISVRGLAWFWLFFAMACLRQPALAIEKYTAVPLPDERLGSQALAVARAGAGNYSVVGSKQMSDGTLGAMYWSIVVDPSDPRGNTVYAAELPKPAGWNAVATGVALLEGDPDRPVIVGRLFDAAGYRRAVLWWRNMSGQFTSTTLDDEAEASAIDARNTSLGLIIVVCGKFRLEDGNWHACVWRINGQGTQRTDLGTLGGGNSEATAMAFVDDLVGWNFVGSAQKSNGRWMATLWSSQGSTALPTPLGAESRANYIGITRVNESVLKIAGEITETNGRRSASIWINQDEIPSGFLALVYRDVLGRANSMAKGIVDYIDEDEINIPFVVGAAWNTESDRTGLGLLRSSANFQNPLVFDFDTLRRSNDPALDWNSVILNAVTMGGVIAGEGQLPGSTSPQAMLFLPTNTEVPQNFNLMVGNEFGDVLALWQEDGRAMRLLPRRAGQVRGILAEWTSTRFSAASPLAPRRLTLVSRLTPRRPHTAASAMLTLQLFDPAAGQWVNAASRILASDEFFSRLVVEIPDPGRFALAGGGPLRWRIGLRGEEWRDFEIDLMEVEVESLP
jgi:hypothetical protein